MAKKTLSELKEEAGILKKRNMARAEILKAQMEKRKLITENRKLRRPGLTTAFSQIRNVTGSSVRVIGSGVKGVLKTQLEIGAKEFKRKKKKK